MPSSIRAAIDDRHHGDRFAPAPWLTWAIERFMAAALFGLGVRKLLTAGFIPAWEPVAPGAHPALAVVDALLLMGLAAVAITGPRRDLAFWGLAGLLAFWIVVLQGPGLIAAPGVVVLWLGVAEVGALVSASALMALTIAHPHIARSGGRNAAFIAFGLCCIVFGISHFAYSDFTATMIPAWIPAHTGFALFTGGAHVAAGLAIASGVLRRLAAGMLALMMAIFVLVINLPMAVSHGSLMDVTYLLNSCALCGSALLVMRTAMGMDSLKYAR
ncbi:MAG: DoxX family membrane protein [Pseudomonadota bacterium]|nr:DoxX family membrane protein [Pseudomonadota bacterium]